MKLRTDFISNSSSASFMMIGNWISKQKMDELVSLLNIYDIRDTNFRYGESKNFFDKIGLRAHLEISEYASEIAVGLYYSDMKPKETKIQFENRIKKLLSKFTGEKVKDIGICQSEGHL